MSSEQRQNFSITQNAEFEILLVCNNIELDMFVQNCKVSTFSYSHTPKNKYFQNFDSFFNVDDLAMKHIKNTVLHIIFQI